MAGITFEFQGERREEHGSRLFPASSDVKSTVCQLSSVRDGGSTATIEIAVGALLEVETDEGAWLLTRQQYFALSNLDENGFERNADGSRQQQTTGKRQLPSVVQLDSGKRGLLSWVLKALRVLDIDLAGYLVRKAAAKLDASLVHNDQVGMYAVGRDGEMIRAALKPGGDPVLLLVHGTASSTLGAFGEVVPNEGFSDFQQKPWQEIYDAFGGRVYAFEHATLTVPVAKNAFDLLTALPQKHCPPLVMLSHSRGGLVADLLASVQHAENHDELFLQSLPAQALGEDRDDSEEVKFLLQLYRLAAERGLSNLPRVIRHVRVGCPAAGTSLAGPNTNIYLTVLAKLFGKIPDLPVLGLIGDLVEALLKLAAAVVKEGLQPGALPGIGSMKPDSILVKLLDGMVSPGGELVVISGDASGVVDKLLMPIFLGPHDWVVDTASMSLGYQYPHFDERALVGDGVSHTHYFERRDVQERLVQSLSPVIALAEERSRRGLSLSRGRVPGASVQTALDKPCLFFLPGFMGSELSIKSGEDSHDIWVDYWRLVRGMGSEMSIDSEDIAVTGVLDDVYEDFLHYADQRAHVVPVPYDWRATIEAPIDDFDGLVTARLNSSTMPVTIVCHSMGGLVARAWRQRFPDTWQRVVERGGYMVQGGTPNLGTWQLPKIFDGSHELLRKLALFDLRNSLKDWQSWLADFPGPAQMAVYDDAMFDGDKLDLSKESGWKALGASRHLPSTAIRKLALKTAVRRAEDGFAADKNIIYVAGCAASTPQIEKKNNKWRLIESGEGDGLALWTSAGKAPDYYIDAVHGDIYNKTDAFDALLDIALKGKTRALSRTQPDSKSRGAKEEAAGQVRETLRLGHAQGLRSGSQQLLAAITHGGGRRSDASRQRVSTQLQVEVLHGNLMFCNTAVLVGHYSGDRIVRAEAALDSQLGGVLHQRWQLGPDFYTSAPGTSQVALANTRLNANGPSGAIVVGLGRMGELSQGDLTRTVMRGVQRYLQTRLEAGLSGEDVQIAALLVGSGNEELKLSEVLEGILNGVQYANDALRSRDGDGSCRVAKVQFVEWHFDLALEARWALEELNKNDQFSLQLKPGVINSGGGVQRLSRGDNDQWWTSLGIEFKEDKHEIPEPGLERLVFSVAGNRAMGVSGRVLVSRDEIERRLKPIFGGGSDAATQAQQTLFEELVPSCFKRFAGQQRNLVLSLDPEAAFIPWELLVDRNSIQNKPLSVDAGMLRRIDYRDGEDRTPKILSDSRLALVVGNPPATRAGYPNLDGAITEAEKVLHRIQHSPPWRAEGLIYGLGEDGVGAEREIMAKVLTGDYQILHFATHGAYVKGAVTQSGVVVGEQKDQNGEYIPLYFQTRHIEHFRLMPSLVFLNCCHTGSIEQGDGQHHHLSASMAAEFMKAGAQAVVAASWAIDDSDALNFADHFYEAMLSGKPFGDAVKIARRAIYNAEKNTWAAFQCYGDPGFTLSGANPSGGSWPKSYQAVEELVTELRNLEIELRAYRTAKNPVDNRLREKLKRIEAAATQTRSDANPPRWADDPQVVYGLALAFGELGDWPLAHDWLLRALDADSSKNSLEDVLRVRNYLIRLMEAQASKWDIKESKAGDEFIESYRVVYQITRSIDAMVAVSTASAVLHEHRGSAWKLVAMMGEALARGKVDASAIVPGAPDPAESLLYCRDAYLQAYQLKLAAKESSTCYAGSNALLLEALVRSATRRKSSHLDDSDVDELSAGVEQLLRAQAGALKPDVWAMLAPQDFAYARWIYDKGQGSNELKTIEDTVVDVFATYGSPGERDSVMKQFRFSLLFIDKKRHAQVEDLINALQKQL